MVVIIVDVLGLIKNFDKKAMVQRFNTRYYILIITVNIEISYLKDSYWL